MERLTLTNAVFLGSLALLVSAVVGCQKVEQPDTVLTQDQWEQVKTHIKDEAPDPEYPINARFGNKIEFIGFDVEEKKVGSGANAKEALVAGEETEFTWYWRALQDMDKNWKIFVHFDSRNEDASGANLRQNLDHQPLDGLFRTSRWPKGKVIEDVQKVTIRDNYPPGDAVPYIGFYRGNKRLPIKKSKVRTTDDRRIIGPTLTVQNPDWKGGGAKKKPNTGSNR